MTAKGKTTRGRTLRAHTGLGTAGTAAIVLALATACLSLAATARGAVEPDPLDLHVTDCLRWKAVWKTISLSNALGQLGGCVEGGYVLFGLEEVIRGGKEPAVRTADLNIKDGMTVRAALQQITHQHAPYEIKVVSSNLVNLFPKGATSDPNDLMNLLVPEFEVSAKDAYTILGSPRDVIPALDAVLTPKPEPGKRLITLYSGGYHPPGPSVTLHLRNVTVRQILNATVEASEASFPRRSVRGWVYKFDPDKSLMSGYRYRWGTLYSLPNGWRYRMRGAGAPKAR